MITRSSKAWEQSANCRACSPPRLSTSVPIPMSEAKREPMSRTNLSDAAVSRRSFIKAQAVAAAAAVAGIDLPAKAQNLRAGPDISLKWSKAPCRFWGPGCGVMVGVKDGRVVATHGDMQAEVNRGLNCVKGYFLSKIMYGADRLTQPLLRKRNGAYAKDGEFTPITWAEAFDVLADRLKQVLKAKGPTAVGMF